VKRKYRIGSIFKYANHTFEVFGGERCKHCYFEDKDCQMFICSTGFECATKGLIVRKLDVDNTDYKEDITNEEIET
jgi:hypothetical protein